MGLPVVLHAHCPSSWGCSCREHPTHRSSGRPAERGWKPAAAQLLSSRGATPRRHLHSPGASKGAGAPSCGNLAPAARASQPGFGGRPALQSRINGNRMPAAGRSGAHRGCRCRRRCRHRRALPLSCTFSPLPAPPGLHRSYPAMLRYLRGSSGKAAAGGGPDVEALLAELQKQVSEATVQAFAGSSELPNGGTQERRALLLRYLRAGETPQHGVPRCAALRSWAKCPCRRSAARGAPEVPSARRLCGPCPCLCKACHTYCITWHCAAHAFRSHIALLNQPRTCREARCVQRCAAPGAAGRVAPRLGRRDRGEGWCNCAMHPGCSSGEAAPVGDAACAAALLPSAMCRCAPASCWCSIIGCLILLPTIPSRRTMWPLSWQQAS